MAELVHKYFNGRWARCDKRIGLGSDCFTTENEADVTCERCKTLIAMDKKKSE